VHKTKIKATITEI